MRSTSLALVTLCMALTGPQAMAAGPAKACFHSRSVTNFAAVNDQTVNLRVGVREVYRLELLGSCPDIDWQEALGLQSRGSSWICDGLDVTLFSKGPFGPQRCPVRSIHKLTPQEIEALPSRDRP